MRSRSRSASGEHLGIRFVETEEAYTSKASFVDNDSLPKHGEKPDGWEPSGKRVKRGLYRTAINWYINADCNGAANIIRKVSRMLGIALSGLSRVSLTAPIRIQLWMPAKKSEKGRLQSPFEQRLESPCQKSRGVSKAYNSDSDRSLQ